MSDYGGYSIIRQFANPTFFSSPIECSGVARSRLQPGHTWGTQPLLNTTGTLLLLVVYYSQTIMYYNSVRTGYIKVQISSRYNPTD